MNVCLNEHGVRDMDDYVGQQLGNYRVLRLLGRGGFSEVYLGEHAYLKNHAALKVLGTQLSEEDTEEFLQEAQTLARLDHPHIVRVLDFAVHDGTPFLVMEYAAGGSLRELHPKGTRVPLERIIAYATQMASALQYAHNQHLLHRDVKPGNMLLGARGQVLLSDFGLAMLMPSSLSGKTQAMDPSMTGTTPYLAPEQLQGQPQPASDQYALGVVVYEWLSGRRPFHGTPIEVAMQHLSAPPPSLRGLEPDLPPVIEEVVMRALAKEPELRFASVQDFATALQAAHQAEYLFVTPLATGTAAPAAEVHPSSLAASTPSTILAQEQADEQTLTVSDTVAAPAILGERQETPTDTPSAGPLWKVPAILMPLVGREQDLAAICALLSRPEVRLVTLLGVGGIGKTSLALQVAIQMRDHFADGVCLVALAPLNDPALMLSSIVYELGIQVGGAQPLLETVKAWLRDKHLLLLLDNFEQIVTAAPMLEELLAACQQLTILVTSREVLHLKVEHLFLVPPLALPDLSRLPDVEDLAQYASVSLFVQRAQAIKPDFKLTGTNARVIAELCVRLDGLPLALELAAARIRLLPPHALLARLSQRFQVLTGGPRTMPERQQTLLNTIKWSYDLLDANERRLFQQLSFFVGGWTLEAAEAVCNAVNDPPMDLLQGVASLLDKSLLQQIGQEGEEPRLVMLETIREYGLERLAAGGELEVTRQAHAEYYLKLAEEAEHKLRSAQQVTWLEQLELEHDNLRAALNWLVERQEVEMALRLGTALCLFWTMHGHVSEGRPLLESILSSSSTETVSLPVRAQALNGAGGLASNQGDYGRAKALYQESLQLSQKSGNRRGIAASINGLAFVAMAGGDYTSASAMFEESLVLLRELGDRWNLADTLYYSALAATFRIDRTDTAAARSMVEESLVISRELGNRRSQAYSLNLLGFLSMLQGQGAVACSLIEESLAIHKALGDRQGIGYTSTTFGWYSLSQGDYVTARAHYEKGLAIMIELNDKWFVAVCLEGLAIAASAQSSAEGSRAGALWAARLWGAAQALRDAIGVPLRSFERAINEWGIAAIRTQLGEEAFAAAWAEGRMMTPAQAFAVQG
jgi:predicted ATPase/serine/threonine protein kinase